MTFYVVILAVLYLSAVTALNHNPPPHAPSSETSSRRTFTKIVAAAPFTFVSTANAIDPSLLKTLPVEGDTSGAQRRLASIAALQQNQISTDPELVDVMKGVQVCVWNTRCAR